MNKPAVLLHDGIEAHSLYLTRHCSSQDTDNSVAHAPNCLNRDIPHHRLVVSHNLLQAVTLPGLDFLKAWADCRLVCSKNDGLELPSLRFRDLLWDPVDNEGVLTDFDLDTSALLQVPEVDWMSSVAGLLTCKAVCDKRFQRLLRDQIEPYVWMVSSAYLRGLDQHE